MFVEICADCIMANAGNDERELGRPYSTEYVPMSLLPMSDWFIVTPCACDDHSNDEPVCEGHFSNASCDGCGETLAGSRFCYSATRFV